MHPHPSPPFLRGGRLSLPLSPTHVHVHPPTRHPAFPSLSFHRVCEAHRERGRDREGRREVHVPSRHRHAATAAHVRVRSVRGSEHENAPCYPGEEGRVRGTPFPPPRATRGGVPRTGTTHHHRRGAVRVDKCKRSCVPMRGGRCCPGTRCVHETMRTNRRTSWKARTKEDGRGYLRCLDPRKSKGAGNMTTTWKRRIETRAVERLRLRPRRPRQRCREWNGKNRVSRRNLRSNKQMQTRSNARGERQARVFRASLLTIGWDPNVPAWSSNEIVCTGRPRDESRSAAGRSQDAARYERYVRTTMHCLLNAIPKLLKRQRYRTPKQCRCQW